MTEAAIGQSERAKLTARAALASIAMAITLIALKSYAALETSSMAMLGSLADSGLDFIASLVVLLGVRIAAQPADYDHRFGHSDAKRDRDAVDGRNPQLACAGAHCAQCRKERGPGHFTTSGDDEDASLRLLSAVDNGRQRMSVERGAIQRLHRVPETASGAEVFGAPCASSGAP